MARSWTAAQASAIETRDRTLLVSAAAGSGKTATLTERIIRTLTDPQNPGDISRMLVVTFTRAAAAELRTRISLALQAAMVESGHSPHLSRQLLLLPGAHISTIDSFCLDLVRGNAVTLGLSPAFRLADPAEVLLLQHSVLDRLIEDAYAGEIACCNGDVFCRVVDCLTGGRGDGDLPDMLLSLYNKTEGFAQGHRVITNIAEKLRLPFAEPFDTPWGGYLRDRTVAGIDAYVARYRTAIHDLETDPAGSVKYLPVFKGEYTGLLALRAAMNAGYSAARDALFSFPKGNLKGIATDQKTDVTVNAAAMRTDMFKDFAKWGERRFAYTAEEWGETLPQLGEAVGLIGRLLGEFSDRLWEEKKRRCILSFSDLSHAALRLLSYEDGTPTPLAAEIGRDFDAVYIDEYQDVNEVQHRLFELLSGPRSRFMVGDIKQSIYGFRGAQPEIFSAIRHAFPPLGTPGDDPAASVSLSQNFRSQPPVLAFANLVFGRLMQGVGEHIGYREAEDALIPGRPADPCAPRVTVALFEKEPEPDNTLPADETGEEAEDGLPQKEENETTVEAAEAAYVARKIYEILQSGREINGRAVRPGDFAILTRRGAPGEQFEQALAAYGIRAETASRRGFFMNPEVLLTLSLLNVVDNPRRDIYLAGLLRSPLFGFSMDDLIALRREAETDGESAGCSLYEALCRYNINHPEFEKGHGFLERLARYRRMAEGQPVDRLIWYLYRETGLLSLAGTDKSGSPATRRANLMLLYDYARRFEAASYRGLYNFIAYINEAIERGQSIDGGSERSERTDTVRIMTIHQSKGLEFPICFLSDCGAGFMKRDATGKLLFDRTLGAALCLRDESGFARIGNPVYYAVSDAMLCAGIEEEMRVLYVALTRPREELYVTATLKHVYKEVERAATYTAPLGASDAYSCRHFADMVLRAAAADTSFDLVFPAQEEAPDIPLLICEDAPVETVANEPAEIADAAAVLSRRFAYEYPYRHRTDLPNKLSVSHLYPTVLDGAEEVLDAPGTSVPDTDAPLQGVAYLPRFMGGEGENKAARAGTATHLFMQFCDFARLRDGGAETELARLVEARFLTQEDADLVRLREIQLFADSRFLSDLLGGGHLYRELRFHARLPAAAFTANTDRKEAYRGETVLVQGVMDGVLLRPDGALWLFDYKTDRLTREEKNNPNLAKEKLAARHALQLSYYALACRDIFGRLPDRVLIYSLPLGDVLDIPVILPQEV